MDAKELQLKQKLEFHLKAAAHLASAIQGIDSRESTPGVKRLIVIAAAGTRSFKGVRNY